MAKSLRTKVRNARAQYEAAFKARWNAEKEFIRIRNSVILEINLYNTCGFFVVQDPHLYPEVIEAFNIVKQSRRRALNKFHNFTRLVNKK